MTYRSRSRSRDRSSVRVKRESPSRSAARREGSRPDGGSVRIKHEGIKYEEIYLDTSGRPIGTSGGTQYPREGDPADSSPREVEKPNFEPSGLLAAETNQRNGIALKVCISNSFDSLQYSTPPESRMPTVSWRLYVFKPDEADPKKMNVLKTIHLDRQEHYIFGCDRRVVDVEMFHPTISKQHAVIQHRLVDKHRILPYIIDLESTNGTFLNDERIQPSRYYELRERDVVKFGRSSREYVVLNDKSM
ncbi:nuclear inhibitor of protein phosphatase-1 like protein [Babesia gibsoni]|uniref:Nuclear inhibitor of protein phosphatase-1 like protein n=1 Tax=Babesia gibsoni TaxID=33632 RepID=A0AAD8PET5_BABGI|nr:nuclear inhibitor of protein phosphatase-1 like protein [Babesia gibsoni]